MDTDKKMRRQYRVVRVYRNPDGSEGVERMMARTWGDMIQGLPGLLKAWDGQLPGYKFAPTIRVWVETRLIEDWHK